MLPALWAAPGESPLPAAAASRGERPVNYSLGAQQKMERIAVSLPAGRGGGQLTTLPTVPRAAMRSMVGMLAQARGVLFPNSGTGLSAMPSPMTSRYFMENLLGRNAHSILSHYTDFPMAFQR